MKSTITLLIVVALVSTAAGCSNDTRAPGNSESIPGANTDSTGGDAGSDATPSTAATNADESAPAGMTPPQ